MIPRTIRMLPALSLTLAMFVCGHLLIRPTIAQQPGLNDKLPSADARKDEGKLAANNGPPRPDRRLVKEPVYRTAPKYYLLAFGRETKTSVWLVFDGTTLYVDRNADGDLTQPGERFTPKESKIHTVGRDGKGLPDLEYDIPDVTEREGKAKHGIYVQLSRATDREGKEYADVYVRVRTAAGFQQYSYFAHNLEKKRVDNPATAPFRHFGGPLHLKASDKSSVRHEICAAISGIDDNEVKETGDLSCRNASCLSNSWTFYSPCFRRTRRLGPKKEGGRPLGTWQWRRAAGDLVVFLSTSGVRWHDILPVAS